MTEKHHWALSIGTSKVLSYHIYSFEHLLQENISVQSCWLVVSWGHQLQLVCLLATAWWRFQMIISFTSKLPCPTEPLPKTLPVLVVYFHVKITPAPTATLNASKPSHRPTRRALTTNSALKSGQRCPLASLRSGCGRTWPWNSGAMISWPSRQSLWMTSAPLRDFKTTNWTVCFTYAHLLRIQNRILFI